MITKLVLLVVLACGVGVAGLRAQAVDATSTPAPIPVPPPPNPLPVLAAPPLRPLVQPLARPDVGEIQRLTPRIEIWRPNALRPQTAARRDWRTDRVFVTGSEPVTVRIRFDPGVAGERVLVIAANSFSINPPEQTLTVSPRGDCAVTGQLAEGASRGQITIRCKMVTTVVPIAWASAARVQAQEERTGGSR
jgi:hypothetical protein